MIKNGKVEMCKNGKVYDFSIFQCFFYSTVIFISSPTMKLTFAALVPDIISSANTERSFLEVTVR
jgi:hypothetical protein